MEDYGIQTLDKVQPNKKHSDKFCEKEGVYLR